MKGFQCFKTFFENVNHNEHKMKKIANTCTYTIEKMDLTGLDYLWRIVLEVPSEEIAMLAIRLLLKLSYTWLSPKLKKDSLNIHKKFILECYKRLEHIMSVLGHHSVSHAATSATVAATVPITHEAILSPSAIRTNNLLSIERLLMIAEHYIITVEDLHAGPRTLLPHGASFHGHPITVNINCDVPKQHITLQCHSNESLRSLRHRIAGRLNVTPEQVQIFNNEKMLLSSKDPKLLYQLEFEDEQIIFVKTTGSSVTMVTNKDEIEMQDIRADDTSASGCNRQAYALEQERIMPGVIMSTECRAFDKLYQLAELEEPSITSHVQRLLMLLPTDPVVQEALDSIGQQFTLTCTTGSTSMDDSGGVVPTTTNLKNMFRCTAAGMSPFRVLYNLE
ncbi:ubiquitin carboxyl-terminal hydrolase 24, partial [Exaiptasia diaphana]|uniref:UBP24/USP9X/USP9Y ubiquitin-like domain-containing protein n=1 Tax=Exaiptasia diaphana TaxID=2652724 RepID=A0A913WUS4_EXADI